jgi:signal transduction histidine kinase
MVLLAMPRYFILDFGDADITDAFFVSALLVPPFLFGRVARKLDRQARLLEEQQEALQRQAVRAERDRIARELHDVIAHTVSVMTVQAGAARLLLDETPERAVGPLLSVEETGRQALAEIRRLFGVLREDSGEIAFEPQPGVGSLEALLARARRAGLPVELAVLGRPAALPPGVDLAAYRVVQEALTNTLRHAGPTSARVAVRYDDDALVLQIVDGGRGGRPGNCTGQGLIGMRERVALYGGELQAGPRAEGGFSVRVRLPVERHRP